ncbi:hypothetical protein [Tissierella praeacuta]|uniref:hypothetical protein n=1 Tax=Tissierella praeacuta TaxID=43131 RepID=UPI00334238D9
MKNNTKPTKAESYINPEEKMLFDEIEKELFHEASPGHFIKKEEPLTIDPNEACYKVIATYIYGFQEYAEKIGKVTDINYVRQKFHKSMLHESISTNNKFDIAIDLIQRGIDVDIQDYNGNTALHYLAGNIHQPGACQVFRLILEQNPNINLLNKRGCSILWLLVSYVGINSTDEEWSLIKKLVEMGADKSVLPEVFQEKLELILDMK